MTKILIAAIVVAASILTSVAQDEGPASGAVKIEELLRANSFDLQVRNGSLSGRGFEFLMDSAARSQFFLLGEPHHAKEVPQIASMLFKALNKRHGFNYLALEQDPLMARMVSAPSVVGDIEYVVSLARKYPNAFIFITDQELEMIAEAGRVSKGRGRRIWGLDQIFGGIHVLDRLSEFAPTVKVRKRTRELVRALRKKEAERLEKLDRFTMADIGELKEFTDLIREYRPAKGSEAEFLVKQMLLSARIYKNNILAGKGELTGFQSNYEREENMKELFMLEYRRAQAAGDRLPKVLFKFGHYHSIAGRNWSNVLTLGNFASEFAKTNGLDSFHLALYVNNASGDYGVLSADSDYKAFAAIAPTDKWTVVDLRPLRAYLHAGRLAGVSSDMRRVIFGFDAALIIGGGSLGTYKLIGVEK